MRSAGVRGGHIRESKWRERRRHIEVERDSRKVDSRLTDCKAHCPAQPPGARNREASGVWSAGRCSRTVMASGSPCQVNGTQMHTDSHGIE